MFRGLKNGVYLRKAVNTKNLVVGTVSAGLLSAGVAASAAVPANVTTALTDSAADTVTVAGLVLAIIVGIMTFRYIRRAL